MGVSINGGSPIAGWLIMGHPAKMDDLGGTGMLGNRHICIFEGLQ